MQFNAMAPIIELPEPEWRLWCVKNWPYQSSLQFAIPVGTITSNSPDTNSVAWADVIIEYAGNQYTITDGNTSDKYLYWELSSPYVIAHSATIPTISENLIVVGINTTGDFQPSWKAGQAAVVANTVSAGALDGTTITGATIQTEATAARGVKITTASGLTGYDGSGNLTFKIHPSTGTVTASSFSGVDTRSWFDIGNDGVFSFQTTGNYNGIKLDTSASSLITSYSTSGESIDLKMSSCGLAGKILIQRDSGGETIATFSSAGLDLASGDVYKINGTQVLGAQAAAEADAAAISGITLNSGADSVDRAAFNTALGTLVTEVNALKSTVNGLLAKLRSHGIIAT